MPAIVLVLKQFANERLLATRGFGNGAEKHVRCRLCQKRQHVFE